MTEALGTVARTLSVLRVVAEAKGTVGVKDVADALGLPMSTSHRLLDLLLEAGFVQKEQIKRRYAIGSDFFRLANLIAHKPPMRRWSSRSSTSWHARPAKPRFCRLPPGRALRRLRRQERQPQLAALPHRSLPGSCRSNGARPASPCSAFLPEEEQAAAFTRAGVARSADAV